MKKSIAAVLMLSILLSLAACDSSGQNDAPENMDGNTENSVTESKQNGNEDERNDETNSETNGETNGNKIDFSRITAASSFASGKAFVRYGEMHAAEYRTVYCIDKTGTILFTLNGINVAFSGYFSGFYNGLSTFAVHENGKSTIRLCTDKGQIIKPEDVGATSFLNSHKQTSAMFKDGYIFVEKTVTDFKGSSTKAAILNSKLEVIVDYSEELYTLYESSNGSWYSGGYLYISRKSDTIEKVLDLNTGNLTENVAEFATSVKPQYESDLWGYKDYRYFDLITGEIKVDLTEYSDTLTSAYFHFEKGVAPVTFRSAGKVFLTIIKEDGSFCFDPVEIKGTSPMYYQDGDKLLVRSSGAGLQQYIESFDTTGKIGELTTSQSIISGFGEGIVGVNNVAESTYSFYTADLKPLFE